MPTGCREAQTCPTALIPCHLLFEYISLSHERHQHPVFANFPTFLPKIRSYRRLLVAPHLRAVMFLVLFLRLPLCAQEGAVVRSIDFQGNDAVDSDALRGVMLTYQTGWISEKIFGSEPFLFGEDVFRTDLQNIVAEYQRQGFLGVQIDTALVMLDDEGETVSLEIWIQEGAPYTITSISIDAPGDSLWTEGFGDVWSSLSEEFALRQGVRFQDTDLLTDRERITRAFSGRGYAYVSADYSLDVDTVHQRVAVRWKLVPGPLCHYGEISIVGNERVETALIENKLPFGPGDIYSSSQLEEVQRDIYSLGQFQAVFFRPRLGNEKGSEIPLTISLQEAPRTKAKLGAGYGAEEHLRAFVELKRLSFLGGARTLTLYAKYSRLTPINTSITLAQPDFLIPKLNLYIRPYILFEKEIGYSVDRFGGDVTLERRLFESLMTSVSYTLEQVNTPDGQEVTQSSPASYNKSALGLSLTLSTAVPVFDPREGWLQALRLFYTGLPPSPEVKFFRALYDIRRYDLISSSVVLATRFKIGTIWSYSESDFVPPEERFYAGGSYSVRGYSRSKLGPADTYGNPIGGKSLLEGSVEFRFPLAGSFGLVAFVDAGNVWEPTITYKLKDIAYAVGTGLRYETPVGPVRFDAARTLRQPGMPWQFHFSIGQAF